MSITPASEAGFQVAVLRYARLRGWRVAHFRPARTVEGWRTAVSADGTGFPDLVLVRQGKLIVAELKSSKGTLTPEQEQWIRELHHAGVEVRVWRPEDWPEIERELS